MPEAVSHNTIWVRRPPDWYHIFCIRVDREGSFHMYPDLDGPYQSLQAAEDAINHYVNGLPRPARCDGQDKITSSEYQIRRILFYPDGTPKRGPNSPGKKNPNYRQLHLVQVVLDRYNDDRNLSGGCAHELDGDVKFNWFDEDDMSYYHLNFRTKLKDAADVYPGTGNLFFAELKQMEISSDYEISCCCIIERNSIDPCFGCIRDDNTEIRHPSNINAYTGGKVDCRYLTFGGDPCSDSDDDEDTQVYKLWIKLEGQHAPFAREKIINWNRPTAG